MFYLVSEADEVGQSFALSENPKTGFFATRPYYPPLCKAIKFDFYSNVWRKSLCVREDWRICFIQQTHANIV